MALLGRRPAASNPSFVQGQWDDLLKTLERRRLRRRRQRLRTDRRRALADFLSTIPYYVYELQLFARADDGRPADWDVLKNPRPDGGKGTIGVLKNTVADEYLTREVRRHVEVVRYERHDRRVPRRARTARSTPR